MISIFILENVVLGIRHSDYASCSDGVAGT